MTRHLDDALFRTREELCQIGRTGLLERRGEGFDSVDGEVRLKESGEERQGDSFFDEMILLERTEDGSAGETEIDEEGGGDGEDLLIEDGELVGVLEDSSKGVFLEGLLQVLVSAWIVREHVYGDAGRVRVPSQELVEDVDNLFDFDLINGLLCGTEEREGRSGSSILSYATSRCEESTTEEDFE